MGGLQAAVADIPLSTMNQVPSDTMGPIGRLQDLVNCVVKRYLPHYEGAQGVVPAKIRVEPRDGFTSLSPIGRLVTDGTVAGITWDRQRLLAELDSQIVSICGGSEPRVWNGNTWSVYQQNAVLTQNLAEEILHTSQHTIQAPDSAWMSGVTCIVWTETIAASTGAVTASYLGFKSDNGTWLVRPTQLFTDSTAGHLWSARVVTDGSHFFVFYNIDATHLNINCYDINGALLAQSGVAVASSGIQNWDITAATTAAPNAGTVLFAAAIFPGVNNASGVLFVSVGFAGGVVTTHANADLTLHCSGPVNFISNSVNSLGYLATARYFTGEADFWVYEVTNLAQTHEYSTGYFINLDVYTIDTMTGYVTAGPPIGVIASIGLLPAPFLAPAAGPQFDPALRYAISIAVSRGGGTTVLRTNQSICQATRAFQVDGNWYIVGYYQSGSGSVLVQNKQTVTVTGGDYMIGAATQPIDVQSSDFTQGSPINVPAFTILGNSVIVGASHAGVTPGASDFVNQQVASAGFASVGITPGSAILAWKFAGLVPGSLSGFVPGSRLVVSGSTISGANGSWDIITVSSDGTIFYTPISNVGATNSVTPSGFFTGGGTVSVASLTGYVVSDLSPYINDTTYKFFFANSGAHGSLTVTGASTGGNNVSGAAIARIYYGTGPNYAGAGGAAHGIVWVATSGQSSQVDNGFQASISPIVANAWGFATGAFDTTYVGADIVVSADPAVTLNVGTYPITSVVSGTVVVTGGATAVIAQDFEFPFPTISIQLTTQVPYTFKLQSITPDYHYQNALVLVQGAANPNNNGTYRITQINADGTFVALPTNGMSNQVNEGFTGAQTITIFFAPNNEPPFQSTWFIVPLAGSQPVAGRFEYGLAYADWRIEGDSTAGPDLFPGAAASVYQTPFGTQFVLPFRAENVTASVTQITAAGQVDVGDAVFASTVGLKQFWLGNNSGHAYSNSNELLIPGPMASVFTSSGFFEDNINLAPEAPFLVSQSTSSSGQLGLTTGSVRIYVVVFEQTDDNGNRIYSPPSPPLVVNMSGTNNVATIGGRVIFPLSNTGSPVANTYGPTCRNVTISIYATAFINGVPTTSRFKITNDLSVNGLAPVSGTNPSGFSFPNSFTWNYVDQNPDSEILANEILYTDKGYLPRFPAPAFSAGVGTWRNREWVIGYDGAIWMSGEKTEGDSIWFNPAFRYVLPTDDEPLGLGAMEDYLIVVCANSIWYIPAATFPDATGQNGTLPAPVKLPFQNGSVRGLTQTIRQGVAYDSTAGGVWLITRNLENVWLSHDVLDSLGSAILDMTIDSQQRLFVLQVSGPIMVYDGIPAAWYAWNTPTTGVLLATYAGQAVYQDGATVNVVTVEAAADLIAGVTYGIAPDITFAPFNFGNVRGLKRVWEFQVVGTYLGPHRLNVTLAYPEDGLADVFEPFTPPGSPYVFPFNPTQEEAAQYQVRVFADFVGVAQPGKTFALEMISAQVGMDSRVGLAKLPENITILAP